MLAEQLEAEWGTRLDDTPIDAHPTFRDGCLRLGAGAVLASLADDDDAPLFEDGERRVCVLLSAAYRRPFGQTVLTDLHRAMKCWRRGELALAQMRLALAGLGRLAAPREAARRLFMADRLLDAGADGLSEVLRNRYAHRTIAQTMSDFAPPGESGNGPVAYARHLARAVGGRRVAAATCGEPIEAQPPAFAAAPRDVTRR